MTYVLDNAKEGYDERLALFSTPPVETAIQDIYYKDYRPVGQITGDTVLEFDVHNNSSDYIILSDIALLLTLQIITDTGKAITEKDDVGLINFPACTIFRQQDFSIQHQVITSSVGSNFPYKVMLDALLKYGRNEHLSYMAMGGFEKDSAGMMDEFDPKTSGNNGLATRALRTADGKKAVYKTRLFNDISQQKRFLLNNLPLNLKLYPAPDEQRLMYTISDSYTEEGTDPPVTPPVVPVKYYSLQITDATLVVPFAKIHPGMITAQANVMKKEMALYPFTRSEVKAYNIANGSFNWTMDNLFQDSIPKRLVVAFVSSAAYSGNSKKNPFNFQNFSLTYIDFQVDGQSSGSQVLQPDYANANYVVEYSKLFEVMPHYQKEPPNIEYLEYKDGYCIYVFDLEKSKDECYSNPLRRGQTRLTIKFLTALTEPVTVLVYGTFESLMKIDEARNVIVET